jgi:hypothetical protein
VSGIYNWFSKAVCSVKPFHRFSNTGIATDDAVLAKKRVFKNSVKDVKGGAELDYTRVKIWVEFLSQFGFATRGVVYGLSAFWPHWQLSAQGVRQPTLAALWKKLPFNRSGNPYSL